MNKRSPLLLIFFIFLLSETYGQYEIKTNVLGLLTNNYNAQVELLINKRSGLELEGSFRTAPWMASLSGSEIKNKAFRFLAAYKYYWGGNDPTSGLYLSPYARIRAAGMENIPVSLNPSYTGSLSNPGKVNVLVNSVALGLSGGQKITLNNNIILEFYGGLGYNLVNEINIRGDYPPELDGLIDIDTNSFTWPWDFRLGFALGYRIWR